MKWANTVWFHTTCQVIVCLFLFESTQPIYWGFASTTPRVEAPSHIQRGGAPSADWNQVLHQAFQLIPKAMKGLSSFFVSEAHAQIITSSPNDLLETIDAQFTQAIQDQANALGNDPVQMYNWVRNNIEVVPSFGSLLGADLCLSRKQCNPFDTASLLIAMYRVSNIAAHYVEGTIRVPIGLAQSWFGGATPADTLAALTAGKVSATFVTDDIDTITAIQMDHMWVEGFVDYVPLRGDIENQGDHFIGIVNLSRIGPIFYLGPVTWMLNNQ